MSRLSKEDFMAYSVYALFVLVVSMIAFPGCKTVTPPVVRLASELDASGAPVVEQYQIPVEQGKIEEPPGWENKPASAEIIVPPSDKPTVIHVQKKPASLARKVFPARKEVTIDVISDNPAVTVKQEPEAPWWYWALGISTVLGAGWFAVKKYMGPLSSAWNLVSRFWK